MENFLMRCLFAKTQSLTSAWQISLPFRFHKQTWTSEPATRWSLASTKLLSLTSCTNQIKAKKAREKRFVVSAFWHHSWNQMLLFSVTRFSSHKQLEFTQLHNARLHLEASSFCSLRVTSWRVCLNELWIKNVSLFLFAVKCLVRKTNKTANFWWKNCRSLGGGGCLANDGLVKNTFHGEFHCRMPTFSLYLVINDG